MRNYSSVNFKDTIKIQQFHTVEYYEATSLFDLEKEEHEFWELCYIDEGLLRLTTPKEQVELKQGELFLIPPKTEHEYESLNAAPATLLFVCFSSSSSALKILEGKHVLSKDHKLILEKMISEIRSTFTFTFYQDIRLIESPEIGGQQLTKNYLIELLINLIRKVKGSTSQQYFSYKTEYPNDLVNKILSYLKNNIYSTINLDYLSERLFYSKAYLNATFKESVGHTIKYYYNYLKIKEAKKILRADKNISITQVSEKLCFDNPSYFIKVFKKYANLTPEEYRNKVL